MHTVFDTTKGMKLTTFSTPSGVQECYFTLVSSEGLSFEDAISELTDLYAATLLENGLDESTLQFTRFYFSDITNDFNFLINSDLFQKVSPGAVSFIQQGPLGGGPLGMLVYHIKSEIGSFRQNLFTNQKDYNSQKVCTAGKNYSILWCTNFTDNSSSDSASQTRNIFSDYTKCLQWHKMDLRHNTIRTWIYVRDIDNNYAGMVKERRELFDKIGLTPQTRYIASTGIEGKSFDPHRLVSMDALNIGNIKEGQIIKMEALDNLSCTSVYGVTFDRGTRIRFGDRSHFYISGTASIDKNGNILYESDVRKQLDRTIDNVEALLEPHGAKLSDMMYLILYLRNPKHYPLLTDILNKRIPDNVSLITVEGPVCRPGWLVEMEGVGIISDETEYPPLL
ncbi:MAG TPA: Rid family hydrolase [Chitinispirillaceae bacterium]|nr:Rid family hydrolase [Chitinispirillaceae bacterium]